MNKIITLEGRENSLTRAEVLHYPKRSNYTLEDMMRQIDLRYDLSNDSNTKFSESLREQRTPEMQALMQLLWELPYGDQNFAQKLNFRVQPSVSGYRLSRGAELYCVGLNHNLDDMPVLQFLEKHVSHRNYHIHQIFGGAEFLSTYDYAVQKTGRTKDFAKMYRFDHNTLHCYDTFGFLLGFTHRLLGLHESAGITW